MLVILLASSWSAVIARCAVGRYWGCYPEVKGARAFSVSAGTYDPSALNPSLCTSQCARWAFRYAALTEGKFCFCAARLPTAGVTTDGYCNIPCSDTGSATACGGLNYIRSASSISLHHGRIMVPPGPEASKRLRALSHSPFLPSPSLHLLSLIHI